LDSISICSKLVNSGSGLVAIAIDPFDWIYLNAESHAL